MGIEVSSPWREENEMDEVCVRTNLSWTAPQKQVALAYSEVEKPSVAPPARGKNDLGAGAVGEASVILGVERVKM